MGVRLADSELAVVSFTSVLEWLGQFAAAHPTFTLATFAVLVVAHKLRNNRLVKMVLAFLLARWLRDAWRKRSTDRARPGAPASPPPVEPMLLYRYWNAAGRLLYVGITAESRGGRRWEEHMESKPWYGEAASCRIERHPNRAAALYAEAVAIDRENPIYNIQRPDPELLKGRAS